MAIIKKIKEKAKKVLAKAATYTYNTVNKIGSGLKTVGKVFKDTITEGKGGELVAGAINAITPKTKSQAEKGGLDYSQDRKFKDMFNGERTPYGASGSYGPVGMTQATGANAGKTTAGMTKYTPGYMTPAPRTSSSSTKLSSKSNYNTASYGTDLTALSSSNFTTGSPISTSINAGSLSSKAGGPTSLPSAPSPKNYNGTAIGGNVAVGANPENGMMPTPSVTAGAGETTKEQPKEDATSMYQKAIDKLFKEKDTSDELYERAQKESGIFKAQQQMQNTQNAINGITSKMNTDILNQRKAISESGGTVAGFGSIESRITRDATIQLLPLQAQLAADQGNLEMAESNLDTLFKIYSDDAEDSFNFYANQAKVYYDKATKDEQKQLDAITEQKKFEQGLVKDQVNAQQSYMSQALKDGNIRLFNALKGIQPPTNINSPSYAQDRQNYIDDVNEAVGNYGAVSQVTSGVVSNNPALAGLPPVQKNAEVLQDIFKNENVSAGARTSIGNGLALSQAAKDLAESASGGEFSGLYPGRGVVDFFTPEALKREQTVKNESLISALNLQTQFWASGAALSDEQTKLVEKMIPKKSDTDSAVRSKTNQLVNYMLSQTSSRLLTEGINFKPEKVDLFDSNSGGNSTNDGTTKVYEGVTYKVINGVWTPQ